MPRDLLIFLPCLSLTREWSSTYRGPNPRRSGEETLHRADYTKLTPGAAGVRHSRGNEGKMGGGLSRKPTLLQLAFSWLFDFGGK